MTCTEFVPDVTLLAEMFVQLENPPHIRLIIFLVLGINGIEFTRCAGRGEKWAVEERGKTREGV